MVASINTTKRSVPLKDPSRALRLNTSRGRPGTTELWESVCGWRLGWGCRDVD